MTSLSIGAVDITEYGLPDEEFFLVLATPFQVRTFAANAFRVVCVDATHSVTNKEVKLISVVVPNERGELVPVAFCLAREETREHVRAFLDCLRLACEDLGLVVHPRVLMSDDSAAISNGAIDVWPCLEYFLLCVWHVRKAWKEQLASRIKSKKSLQEDVWTHLMVSIQRARFRFDTHTFV